jgi:RimJ/RimL family protein N-acetyltransferase
MHENVIAWRVDERCGARRIFSLRGGKPVDDAA